MVRILHTADLHLGMKFAAYPEVQSRLSEARFTALETLVERANSEQCNILVIAGDLFDRPRHAVADIRRAAQSLERFDGEVAVVLPGNHDFAGPKSDLWIRFRAEAGDRTLLIDTPQAVDLRHYGVSAAVYPAPCFAKHSHTNGVDWITAQTRIEDVDVHIGVAHGSLSGISPDPEGQYYPMSAEELRALHPDLWLLGHSHIIYPEHPNAGDRVFNPGTPEPDGFDCTHGGNAFIIDVSSERKITVRAISTGTYRFEIRPLKIEVDTDFSALGRSQVAGLENNLLLRLVVSGTLVPESREALNTLEAEIGRDVFHLLLDETGVREALTPERIRAEFSDGSLAGQLLSTFLDEEDSAALSAAYDMLQEARRDT